jgi:hypothetical protein
VRHAILGALAVMAGHGALVRARGVMSHRSIEGALGFAGLDEERQGGVYAPSLEARLGAADGAL